MLYSVADVSTKTNLSVKAIRRYIASGDLVAIKSGSSYKVTDTDLDIFMDKLSKSELVADNRRVKSKGKTRKPDDVNWVDISEYWNDVPVSDMTFVDLFCGCGGLSRGLEMSGMCGICGLDWFKEAMLTYNHNFNHPMVYGDITHPDVKKEFYDTVRRRLGNRRLNVIAGGFPCQGFSFAGNRIVDDPRNSLYKEMLEIVDNLKPDFVICENVKGLRSMLDGAVEAKIIEDYRNIGYEMNVTVLCAADYYVPQKRERVIFIGNRVGVKNYHPRPILTPDAYVTVRQAISDLMRVPDNPDFNHVRTVHSQKILERMKTLPEGKSLYKGYSDAWKRCYWELPSCTVKENHGGVNIHPKEDRVFTARELARLQSFPDDFIFMGSKNKQLVQIGNAVPCLLGKAIGLAVRHSAGDFESHKRIQKIIKDFNDYIDSLTPEELNSFIYTPPVDDRCDDEYNDENNDMPDMTPLMIKNIGFLKSRWETLCKEYAKWFCYLMDFDYETSYWIADDIGGLYEVNDFVFNMHEIRYIVDHQIPFDTVNEWYNYNLDNATEDNHKRINIESWHIGLRPEMLDKTNDKTDADQSIATL